MEEEELCLLDREVVGLRPAAPVKEPSDEPNVEFLAALRELSATVAPLRREVEAASPCWILLLLPLFSGNPPLLFEDDEEDV